MMPILEVNVEEIEEISVIKISGPVDSASMDQFKDALHAMSRKQYPLMVMDFKDLSYMNSRAIGLLAAFHRETLVRMGKLVICNQNRRIERGMQLLGQALKIQNYPSREEAIDALKTH